MEDDHKEVRFGIMGEGQELSEEDESRIDEAVGGVAASMAHQIGLQKQQQQLIVRWERFLPVRVLKVLLVENDDSTRQVVSALLRNCSYEVTGVTNGLQAWKILEDLTNHIDLVLTEVVMPCLSGIGLLYKIMSHKTCKNIPVIMMSSNDSMGTVFKCLSEGAVDFLVKPIRKNELKNLWQHVWRRCHSSSISGSESGNQTQKPPKSKSADDSNNNTGSNDEDSSGSINARDGSDNGSGTQNSSTKRAIEVNSPRPLSPSDQLADRHDNACVQVIHPKIETFSNEWVPMTANGECTKQTETADDFMGKDLEIGVPRNLHTQHESYPIEKVSTKLAIKSVDELPESDAKNECLLGLESSNASDKPSMKAADQIGAVANCTETQLLTRDIESLNGCSKVSGGKGKAIDSSMELPTFYLSLKRRRTTREGGTSTHYDRNVLRHSNHSAFSRYHTSAAASQAPTGYGGSCSPLDNNSEEVRAESTPNMMSNSNPAPAKHGPNGGSDNNDMGSTTKNFFTKPAFKEKIADASSVLCAHPSAFHPVNLRKPFIPQVMQEKIDDVNSAAIGGQLGGIQHQVQVQHSHHHYYHHHLHVHSMQQLPDYDDLSLKTMAEDAPHCGSSNVFAGQMEGNPAIYSLNQSNSGSNHGTIGQNGSSAAINAGGINMESANGITERSWAVGGNGSGSGSGVDQNRFAQREAALNKFRLKRKERNFQKKVRYQSRKRLAEQRPRVRGQFVRHSMYEHTSQEADS